MPYKSTDHLYKLINSLTSAEKRQFKMAMNASSKGSESLFMALFDHIDKNPRYDEAKILKQVKGVTKRQLSNVKSNLYKKLPKGRALVITSLGIGDTIKMTIL